MKDSKIGRGINLVAFDGKTFDVKLTETFDTYLEGKKKVFLGRELFFVFFRNILLTSAEIESK
jgi:hypothetical protein